MAEKVFIGSEIILTIDNEACKLVENILIKLLIVFDKNTIDNLINILLNTNNSTKYLYEIHLILGTNSFSYIINEDKTLDLYIYIHKENTNNIILKSFNGINEFIYVDRRPIEEINNSLRMICNQN